jgi:hypothetical protein
MNEKEDIATYLLRVDEIVNAIRGLGEDIVGHTDYTERGGE